MEENVKSNIWNNTKLFLKGGIILVIILVLLLPASMIEEVIRDRHVYQLEAVESVTSKWAGEQIVTGPVLVLPFIDTSEKAANPTIRKAYVLPDKLLVNGVLVPEKRHRGIYDVMLYNSEAKFEGQFSSIPFKELKLQPHQILWSDAFIAIGLSDLKGLSEDVFVKWNDSTTIASVEDAGLSIMQAALTRPVAINNEGSNHFSFSIKSKGSERFLISTVGKSTEINISSTWKDPSFTGTDLPEHQINQDGFTAKWKTLSHIREFPQAWKEKKYNLYQESVGVDLFIPANTYQKTLRSVRYASLLIILTFIAFFVVEQSSKQNVHPLHYALIGIALILFYALQLSFSEHIGYNAAYATATIATVAVIGWFVRLILKTNRWAVIMAVVLMLLYGYVFTVMQLEDLSLLLGSLGLFTSLIVVMYFMRKLKW